MYQRLWPCPRLRPHLRLRLSLGLRLRLRLRLWLRLCLWELAEQQAMRHAQKQQRKLAEEE